MTGGRVIGLGDQAASDRGRGWIYLIGPEPFASLEEREHFCDVLAHSGARREDWWLLWHAGATDRFAHQQGGRGLAFDRRALMAFLGAAGWYGGWWPYTWKALRNFLDVTAGLQTESPDLEFVFVQNDVDQKPLGWSGKDLNEYIDERSKLPDSPRTDVSIVGRPGVGLWFPSYARCLPMQNFAKELLNMT